MSMPSVPHAVATSQSSDKIACIYARVSTSDQADKGYSLPTQIEACLDLAEREGYVIPPGIPLWREALCCLREWEERRKDEQHDTDKLRGIALWNTIVQRLREQHGALTATNHVFVIYRRLAQPPTVHAASGPRTPAGRARCLCVRP